MKNSISQTGICFGILILITSCISSQSFLPVKGTGSAVDKNFDVSGFQKIDVSGGFDVTLTQGSSESVVLSAQENLFESIHVEVIQGVLKIYTENNLMPTKPLKAKIMFREINKLNVSGGGDVVADNIKATDLEIGITGGGDLTANINAGELNCKISGGGDAKVKGITTLFNIDMTGGGDLDSEITAGSFLCRLSGGGDLTLRSDTETTDMKLELTGGGDADATINTAKLDCSLSGGGNATLNGKASMLALNLNGGGDVQASGLDVQTASFQVSGGSDLHLKVSDELKGNISGGGDVYYTGSPEIVTIDARGGSEVHKE
jgi:hypothetical protein